MKSVVRFILAAFLVIILYLVAYWKIFSAELRNSGHQANYIALAIAIILGVIAWRHLGTTAYSHAAYLLAGALIVGAIGFVLGFFGPLILAPNNNLGPLLGIFITGPIGLLFGIFVGNRYWARRAR